MSAQRRKLLIALWAFWLLVSWLIASLRPGASWAVFLFETFQIFAPGAVLLALIIALEWQTPEYGTATVRRDIFGGIDIFTKRYLYLAFFYEVVARIPLYPITHRIVLRDVETQTAPPQRIVEVKVVVTYRVGDCRQCFKSLFHNVRGKRQPRLGVTTSEQWEEMLNKLIEEGLDRSLRGIVWTWGQSIKLNPSLAHPDTKMWIDPTGAGPADISLNRERVSEVLYYNARSFGGAYGLYIAEVFIDSVSIGADVSPPREERVQTASLAAALDKAGSQDAHRAISRLLKILTAVRSRHISEQEAREKVVSDIEIVNLIRALAGDTIAFSKGVIAFDQTGEVSLRDVAGRDVINIHVTFPEPPQAPAPTDGAS